MKKRKKQAPAWLTALMIELLILLTVVISILLLTHSSFPDDLTPRIYADLSEADYLKKYTDKALTPQDDPAMGELVPEAYNCGRYTYKNKFYIIYAYTFSSEEDAQSYYRKASNVKPRGRSDFGDYGGIKDTILGRNGFFALEGKKCYVVKAENGGNEYEFVRMITENFSREISLLPTNETEGHLDEK